MTKSTEILRRHVASYRLLSPHRSNCIDVCNEIDKLADDVDSYQQREDEIIVALGSKGVLPSEIVPNIECLIAELNNRWVSVEDRLPPKEIGSYIVYVQHPGHKYVTRHGWTPAYGGWLGHDTEYVTHWMPLPSAPVPVLDDSKQDRVEWCPTCKKHRNCWWSLYKVIDGKCSKCGNTV